MPYSLRTLPLLSAHRNAIVRTLAHSKVRGIARDYLKMSEDGEKGGHCPDL
jgi:hypothetical protein